MQYVGNLLIIAGIVLIAACRSTALLTATFEDDTVGALPAHALPGPPAGDSLSYHPVVNPRLRVQASTTTSGTKALVYSQALLGSDATAHNQWISFKGIRSDYTQTIWYYWTARQGAVGGNLIIDVNGTQSLWVTRLKISGSGRVSLVQDVGDRNRDTFLGTLNRQQAHSFIITLNPMARTFNLSIFGTTEGGGRIQRLNIPVLSGTDPSRDFDAQRHSISFEYDIYDSGANPAATYEIESVNINRRQPD